MNQDEITAAYRAHAKARLRGDHTEARRLADQVSLEGRITHLIFITTLFGQIVLDHFGDELDRTALAALTKRLHQRFRDDDRFHPLKAEALVRAMYNQSPQVLMEIAQAEQPTYMWAVMEALIDPAESEAAMEERFDLAEELGREWLAGAFEAPSLAHWRTATPGPSADRRNPGQAARSGADPDQTDEVLPRPEEPRKPGEPEASERTETAEESERAEDAAGPGHTGASGQEEATAE